MFHLTELLVQRVDFTLTWKVQRLHVVVSSLVQMLTLRKKKKMAKPLLFIAFLKAAFEFISEEDGKRITSA